MRLHSIRRGLVLIELVALRTCQSVQSDNSTRPTKQSLVQSRALLLLLGRVATLCGDKHETIFTLPHGLLPIVCMQSSSTVARDRYQAHCFRLANGNMTRRQKEQLSRQRVEQHCQNK
jgi:hypothetical protein